MFEAIKLFAATAPCPGGDFLFFPPWYKYLPGRYDSIVPPGSTGTLKLCTPQITALSDIWLIIAACLEILLRVAALAAVGFVIYGGFVYITSQGEPDKTTQARKTILNAVIGVGIAVSAAAVVDFMAGSVS